MDLTTFLAAALLMISAIGFDTALHPRDILLQAVKSDHLGKIFVTDGMLNDLMEARVDQIFLTPSIVTKPVIRSSDNKGLGVTITDAIGLSHVADALQQQFGYSPDQLRLYVFAENDTVKVLVNGYVAKTSVSFQQMVNPVKDESIVSLVKRATVVGVSYIDPYMTALNLMRRHIKDANFKRSQEVIDFARARLPTTTVNADRSMLENLEGMIALFNNDVPAANLRFQRAVESNPANQIATLNLALTRIALNMYTPAEALVSDMLRNNPPLDPVIRSTAFLTLASADLGLHRPADADAVMKKAADLNPSSPIVFTVWSEVKMQNGNPSGALAMARRASLAQSDYDAYAELAPLYFTLSWQDGQPQMRSPLASMTQAPDTTKVAAPAAPDVAKKMEPAIDGPASKGSKK